MRVVAVAVRTAGQRGEAYHTDGARALLRARALFVRRTRARHRGENCNLVRHTASLSYTLRDPNKPRRPNTGIHAREARGRRTLRTLGLQVRARVGTFTTDWVSLVQIVNLLPTSRVRALYA